MGSVEASARSLTHAERTNISAYMSMYQAPSAMDLQLEYTNLGLQPVPQLALRLPSGTANPINSPSGLHLSARYNSNAGMLSEVNSRHASFTSGHTPWGPVGPAGHLETALTGDGATLEALIQAFSPKHSASGVPSAFSPRASAGSFGNGNLGGPGLSNLSASSNLGYLNGGTGHGSLNGLDLHGLDQNHAANTAVDNLFSQQRELGCTLSTRSSMNNSLQPQQLDQLLIGSPTTRSASFSHTPTFSKDTKLSGSFAHGVSARRMAVPSKLRHGSIADDHMSATLGSTGLGDPAAQALSEALSGLQAQASASYGSKNEEDGAAAAAASSLLDAATAVGQAPSTEQAMQAYMAMQGYPLGSAYPTQPGLGALQAAMAASNMGESNYSSGEGQGGGGYQGGFPVNGGYGSVVPVNYGNLDPNTFMQMQAMGPGQDPFNAVMMRGGMMSPGMAPYMPVPSPMPGFPSVTPAEYASYYQRVMEAQAMAAMGMNMGMGMAPMGMAQPVGSDSRAMHDMYGGQQQGRDMFGAQQQGRDMYGGQQQGRDMYGGLPQGRDMYGGQQQGRDVYGGQQQGRDMYGGLPQGRDMYGLQQGHNLGARAGRNSHGGSEDRSSQGTYPGDPRGRGGRAMDSSSVANHVGHHAGMRMGPGSDLHHSGYLGSHNGSESHGNAHLMNRYLDDRGTPGPGMALGPRSSSSTGQTVPRRGVRRESDPRGLALLEDLKCGKGRRLEFADVAGHIHEFSLDQHGSRFVQQRLEVVSAEEREVALTEVLPRALSLMTDVFGNYVIQKFLEYGTPAQRLSIGEVLKGQVLGLSLQMYGCRVVQKALEVLPQSSQCALLAELDGNVMRCVRDQNGNHVIQKIIECVPTERITALLDNFLACVVPLSTHPFGCRVIQRILEHCKDNTRKAVVMDEILRSVSQLSQDQYGNYVIQHVLERGSAAERGEVVAALAPQIVAMSMHKFASNVVEKCLTHCLPPERDVLIKAILAGAPPGSGVPGSFEEVDELGVSTESEDVEGEEGPEDPLHTMMKDQFANYVVQKVLEVCDDQQREHLLGRVRAQLHALKKYTYGKHIVARVEKLLQAGTKIQSHLRARPLPDDTAPLHPLGPAPPGPRPPTPFTGPPPAADPASPTATSGQTA